MKNYEKKKQNSKYEKKVEKQEEIVKNEKKSWKNDSGSVLSAIGF